MAKTIPASHIAHLSEVARYLSMDPDHVRRLIKYDRLPALRIPVVKRTVYRIPLRDFHRWLLGRSVSPSPILANYELFLGDFDACVRMGRGKSTESSAA